MPGTNRFSRRHSTRSSSIGFAAAVVSPHALINVRGALAQKAQQPKMPCCQCGQTSNGTGCARLGVWGKKPGIAAPKDLLVHALKGFSAVAIASREGGIEDIEVHRFIRMAAFSTLANVDFDPERVVGPQLYLETAQESAQSIIANRRLEWVPGPFVQTEDEPGQAPLSDYVKINPVMFDLLSYMMETAER